MASPFLNNDFDSILTINAISSLYPQLIQPHKDILLKYLRQLIMFISMIYNFNSNVNAFMHELTQNNYQDLKWLCSMLIPYLESADQLTSFDEMYHKKKNDLYDINKQSPKYMFTNLQYGRCIRGNDIKELDFDELHIEHNFKLLISSLIESSHKLYVNWMDVLPIPLNEYTKTTLFLNSLEKFKSRKINDISLDKDIDKLEYSSENIKNLHSIQISDIYNVIRNYLYEDIIPIKLLIYDLIDEVNKTLIPSILFFKHYFNEVINDMLNETMWNSLDDSQRDNFEQKLNKLFKHAVEEIELSVIYIHEGDNASYSISKLSIQRLVKALSITFDNTYRNVPQVIKSGYVPIKKIIEEEKEMDDEKVYDDYSIDSLKEQINSISPRFIYEHLRRLIQRLKFTVYGNIIFDDKKEQIVDSVINPSLDPRYRVLEQVTLKNIYNFAKSLSRYKKGKDFPVYPKHWKNLELEQKQEIIKRLNSTHTDSDWFNIKRYIRYILGGLGKDTSSTNVDNYNRELFTFISENYIIDLIFKSMIFKGVLSQLKPNKELTDNSFSQRSNRKDILSRMNPAIFSNNTDNPYSQAYSYLSELPYIYSGNIPEANKSGWFSLYALDWVSQIGFVHKYIHQRVTYMTGATGVGKSTQVPKLYMYYLKAIDYNSYGKVVCTQPRKAPTKKNAEQVSTELGFPIFINNRDSDYYYVQMHHKTQQHITNANHLSLKYITDGTLVQEFKNASPLLKRILDDSGKVGNQNLYDIIIIDEAHEHGKNMDILLTLMRDFCYFNPSIKLVILSATMDDDEPVYRRYYRDINDNQKYPIDCKVRDMNLDRVNIDRRYHISPAGLGTTHKIDETYMDGSNPVDIVKMIVREGLKGDILVFQPGEADIIKLVEELNKETPDDVIALPFYSSMSDDKKTFIENIDSTFPSLRISKRESFSRVSDLTKGSSSYRNCIICCTNIAEASITIRRLYYVIETGTRKGLMYSYSKRAGKLVTLNISESSRLQRKGRVGRTGQGHVYYTYKKGLMENNKILFEFSTGNVSDIIFSLLQSKLSEKQITIDELLSGKEKLEQFSYLFSTNKGRFNYIGNTSQYDYDYDNKYIPQLFETGYTSDTTYDANGLFYIVHPEELYLERDLMGRIKGSSKADVIYNNQKIDSYKMNSFIEDLYMKKYLNKSGDDYHKTPFGKLISEISTTFGFDDPALSEILTYSLFFNSSDDICRIVSMLAALNGNLLDLFTPIDNNVYNLTTFKQMFKSYSSEFDVLNELGKQIIKYIFSSFDTSVIDKEIKTRFKLSETDYNDMMSKYENIESEEEGTKMKLRRELVFSAKLFMILSHPDLYTTIERISDLLHVNKGFVRDFLELYFTSSDLIKSLYFPNKRNKNYGNDIKLYDSEYKDKIKDGLSPILLTLLHAQPFNVAKRIIHTNHFLSVYNPSSENIYTMSMYKQAKQSGRISYEPTLLIPNEYVTSYVFFNGINIQRESLTCVAYLKLEYLLYFKQIYNYDRLNKISEDSFKKIDKYIEKLNDPLIPKQITEKDIKSLQHIATTFNEIKREIK
jgi:hypothetical protein